MTYDPPEFDGESAAKLLKAAQEHLEKSQASWRALDPSDPGVALLEAVACIAEQEIKRINALPAAMEARFAEMLGLPRRAATAPAARIEFTLNAARAEKTLIPKGLRIAREDDAATIFALVDDVTIDPGETTATGVAAAVKPVALSVVGMATGEQGLEIDLPHDDLPDAPDEAARIDVLVEWPVDPPSGADIVEAEGRQHVRFSEVRTDWALDGGPYFMADRVKGRLRFPTDKAFTPREGARIRAAYTTIAGDPASISAPAAGKLTQPLDAIPGVSMTNPAPAVAGIAAETVEEMLADGPAAALIGGQAFQARDYELLAKRVRSDIARAHAYAAAETWTFATPGKVNVLLLPSIVASDVGAATGDEIATWTTVLAQAKADPLKGAQILPKVRQRLAAASPLGVDVSVDWLQTKPIGVACHVYVTPGTPHDRVRRAVRQRLDAFLSPLPNHIWREGWPLGYSLRQSNVIEALQSVAQVRTVDKVEIRPRYPMTGTVTALVADACQAGVWFAVIGGVLYRSTSDGDGWTRCYGEHDTTTADVTAIAAHPIHSGMLAVALADGRIIRSVDCGVRFTEYARADFPVRMLCWAGGGEEPRLLVGGEGPLSESTGPGEDQSPPAVKVLMAQDGPAGAATALTAFRDGRGGRLVAMARAGLGGVIFSNDSGWDGGFEAVNLTGHDVRALAFVTAHDRTWLVAGCARPFVKGQHAVLIAPVDPELGTVGHLIEPNDPNSGPDREWSVADAGWPGGGIAALAVAGDTLIAARSAGGLAYGTLSADGAIEWRAAPTAAALPSQPESDSPAPLGCVTAAHGRVAIGGEGVIAISGTGRDVSDLVFRDVGVRNGANRISIPNDWAIAGDVHTIEVFDAAD